MKLIFPGTGSGETSLNYNHSSILIQNGINILIDAGDGIARALLQNNVYAKEIDKIIITHLHADHCAGLASLITQMKLQTKTTPLDIFIHPDHIKNVKTFLNMSNLFTEILDFDLTFTKMDFGKKYSVSDDLSIIAFQNDHITNKHKLMGYNEFPFISSSIKMIFKSVKMFYTADLNGTADFNYFDLKDVDILITEITHFKFEDLINTVKNLPLKRLYFTHIPDELRDELQVLAGQTQKSVGFDIVIASDGMWIEI